MNTAIYTPSGGSVGIGFDIPANVAAQVTQQLVSHGEVTRGYIGATVQNLSPDLADSMGLAGVKGALVDQLTPGGPAQQAGVHSGDVVTRVNGQPVDSSEALTRQVALAHPGQQISITVLRGGHPVQLEIRSGVRPSEDQLASADQGGGAGARGAAPAMLGMQVAPDPNGGLVVQGLSPSSDAAQKGIQQGDVILSAGQQPLQSPGDLAQAVAAAKASGRSSVPLLMARNGQRFFVPVDVGAAAGAG